MVNLTFLETFVWVARLKSFTLAAERLNATQAAISSRVAALESELGVKLFYREHRRLSLTPQGVEALARAEQVLQTARTFVDEVTGAGQIRGTLRIGVIQFLDRKMDPGLSMFDWPSFAQVGTALGGQGIVVDSNEALDRAIKAIETRDKPLLIELKLNPNEVPRMRM